MENVTEKGAALALMGARGRDKVTGYAGTVTSITWYLDGHIRLQLEATIDDTGKATEPQWFGIERVQVQTREPPQAL